MYPNLVLLGHKWYVLENVPQHIALLKNMLPYRSFAVSLSYGGSVKITNLNITLKSL